MPYSTSLIHDGTGVLRNCHGILTVEEILEWGMDRPPLSGVAGRITHGLVDLTEITALELSTDDIQAILASDKKTSASVRKVLVAIVAPRDSVFGMGRMYELYNAIPDWSVHVFRTRDLAEAWLMELLPNPGD